MSSAITTLVIPCYNEAERLDCEHIEQALLKIPGLHLIFVNDGSSDNTEEILQKMTAKFPRQCKVISLTVNSGKAKAVYTGLNAALKESSTYIGYWDADMATPLADVEDFLTEFQTNKELKVVTGARVSRLGATITRHGFRHYTGRIIATLISMILQEAVYDTQCGAKLFKVNEKLTEILHDEFNTNWLFDVEILLRLRQAGINLPKEVKELPLQTWIDKEDSKVKWYHIGNVIKDLLKLRKLSKVKS